jgi:hypothetical protein
MNKKQTKQIAQHIVIADRGWVWVGNITKSSDSITIKNARCIRRWGTTKGIGELAESGPNKDTVLDQSATVVVPSRAIIAMIVCKTNW